MIDELTFAVAGAGGRGAMFSDWLADHVGTGSVVAVAEPDPVRRQRVADRHQIPEGRRFASWQELLAQDRLAEVLINTTMDREHPASATASMRLGYHMLLEKPMATSLAECEEIDRVRQETGRIVSVCHSLRYHAAFTRVREILRSGAIGDVVSLDQLEAVEHIHQSHSFVRGNWGNRERSTFMLLSKSCHDIDIIADLIQADCLRVSSFGSLQHFRPEHAPAGAPVRCVDGCPAELDCPYHALKVYGEQGPWRYHAGLEGLDRKATIERLRISPYGRCVYQTDNDVVDHQVVNMEFAGGITATFTMTAFTPWGGRYVRVHGTHGYIEARIDQGEIDVYEFWQRNRRTTYRVPEENGSHGGADDHVMRALIAAVHYGEPQRVLTGTAESLRTHRIVFCAEQARQEGRVVEIPSSSGSPMMV